VVAEEVEDPDELDNLFDLRNTNSQPGRSRVLMLTLKNEAVDSWALHQRSTGPVVGRKPIFDDTTSTLCRAAHYRAQAAETCNQLSQSVASRGAAKTESPQELILKRRCQIIFGRRDGADFSIALS
jgi:hypothetical protein